MTHLGCQQCFELVIIIIIIMVKIQSPFCVPCRNTLISILAYLNGSLIKWSLNFIANKKIGVLWHSLVIVFFDCRGQVSLKWWSGLTMRHWHCYLEW